MDSNKKFMLSFIGSCLLIVLVVGVSYAFFTYSRMGYVTNRITTGNIVFDFQDGTTLQLTNQFPCSYSDALLEEYREDGQSNGYPYGPVLRFTITGSSSIDGGLVYNIYAIKGNDESTNLIKDNLMYLQIKPLLNTSGYSVTSYGDENIYSPSGTGGSLDGLNSGREILLLSGKINTEVSTAHQVYEVRMWLDDRHVMISDTTNTDSNGLAVATDDLSHGKYGVSSEDVGKYVYTTTDYENKEFSVKIKVVANEDN